MMVRVALILASIQVAMAFRPIARSVVRTSVAASNVAIFEPLEMAKKPKEPEKEGFERLKQMLDDADNDPKKKKGPPIYEPGGYPQHVLAALPYLIPIADAADLGKYMFEAYPAVASAYTALFGPIVAIYNGVPFLPFAIFFLLSYVCRAPTFPVEVRFHASQAFMLSVIQFVPSLLFGLLEKGGVPGLAIPYNTGKCCHEMNPLSSTSIAALYSSRLTSFLP
jgi:hypothetical protein